MGGSNHYCKHYSNFNWCRSQCPLYVGCPLVGGSIIGFTVHNKSFLQGGGAGDTPL